VNKQRLALPRGLEPLFSPREGDREFCIALVPLIRLARPKENQNSQRPESCYLYAVCAHSAFFLYQ
jgi:hypothetical protein